MTVFVTFSILDHRPQTQDANREEQESNHGRRPTNQHAHPLQDGMRLLRQCCVICLAFSRSFSRVAAPISGCRRKCQTVTFPCHAHGSTYAWPKKFRSLPGPSLPLAKLAKTMLTAEAVQYTQGARSEGTFPNSVGRFKSYADRAVQFSEFPSR